MPTFSNRTFLRQAALTLATAACMALTACGGSSGGSSSSSTPAPTTQKPTTGTVGLLLTDGPTDAFCQVLATVERVDLLSDSGSTTLFTGPETVDVLAMRNYADVFSVATAVPVGSYDKIRLTLSDLALVECDAAGIPEPSSQWDHPKLPGNGKLDLNPRGSFQVVGGETMIIEIDLDMQKSLHVHQTGGPNPKWMFRPVVFVTITPDDSRLVRVFGEVRDLNGTTFELCPLAPVSSMDNQGGSGSGDMAQDDDSGRCIDVVTDGKTGIFGPDGLPVGLGSITNGALLTAVGFLSSHDDSDDNDSNKDDLLLNAVVLEIGPQDTFQRMAGSVVTAPGNNNLFEFDTVADPPANPIDVLLQSGTRIFAIGSNQELTSAAAQPGTTGEVDGVFAVPASFGEPLRSSLIVLDQDATPDVVLADATIMAIPADDDAVPATRRLTVDATGMTGKCVKTDAGTRYLKITESPTASETAEIGFADLLVNDIVDVYGSTDSAEPACILADTIQKYVTAP